jgi:cytochrome c55X
MRAAWAALLLALPAGAAALPDTGELSAAERREARELLRGDCGACHGGRLTGGLGPALTPERLQGRDPRGLYRTIRQGRPDTPMPPWSRFLSPAQTAYIVELITGQRPDFRATKR